MFSLLLSLFIKTPNPFENTLLNSSEVGSILSIVNSFIPEERTYKTYFPFKSSFFTSTLTLLSLIEYILISLSASLMIISFWYIALILYSQGKTSQKTLINNVSNEGSNSL